MKPAIAFLSALALACTGVAAHAAEPAASAGSGQGRGDLGLGLRRVPHQRRLARRRRQPDHPGQHPDYLVKQLVEFKAGKRDNRS
jgi:cytochrome c553